MKISYDEYNYVLPEKQGVYWINESEHTNNLICKLNDYFGKKKKNACVVVNEDNDRLTVNDYDFIYIPFSTFQSIKNNLDFEKKTILNELLMDLIVHNDKDFYSIELIRDAMHSLLTDQGMFNIKRILNKGIESHFDISTLNFDINNIISNLCMETGNLSDIEQLLVLYNASMFLKRQSSQILLIDFPVTEILFRWINLVGFDNKIIILRTDTVNLCEGLDINVLITNNSLSVELFELSIDQLNTLIYMLNPFVYANLSFQKNENISLIKQFSDIKSNILINSTTTKTLNL